MRNPMCLFTRLKSLQAGFDKRNIKEMKAGDEDDSDIWHLRKEHEDASKALRNRKISHDNCSVLNDRLNCPVEEIRSMRTAEEISRPQRPSFVHRKTDPCPMREFVRHNWNNDDSKGGDLTQDVDETRHEMTCERDEVDMTADLKTNVLHEEAFLISSYQLAKRRLSLPISSLSTLEQTWTNRNTMFDDSDDTDNVSLESPVKNSQRPSCIKQLQHSPSMERRRRQSAWARARSLNDEINKPLSKRRMSELPALSALATRRRSAPHTISLPLGLRRKTSRAGTSSDHQSLNSSCLKAKNEMLATLSLSSWSENVSLKHHELSRRKTCHTGFGIMALKKKEEKRLMVAQEILQTEKNYINALETLNEVFTEPLKNSCVIPEKDIRTMFPKQLVAMKNGHEKFMNELDERLKNWNWEGVLGDIFTRLGNSYHIDFMTLYSEYVNNFPKSIAVINKYTRNSHKFKRFLEKCGNDPRCERLTISAFLLTPIQRLPRYVLLLRQLAKYTDPNHPDSFHIEISLEKMIDIINILNSSIQSSTKVVRNASTRRSSRRRRKRNIFKPKETPSSNLTSPRKSSDDSECSEASTPSIPHGHDLSPLSIDTASATGDLKSSDYGSLTPSETPPEPRSPSPSSGTSLTRSNFLKVILRNGSESRRRKRRPLSTTEVEIRRNDCSQTLSKDAMKRSVSRDSIGSMIRSKFTLRRRPRSSDENFDKNLSLERLSDSHTRSFKYLRPASPEENSFNELNECSRSDSDFVEEKKTDGRNSCSSIESCTGSREHIPLSRARSLLARAHSPLTRKHSPLAREHSPLTREHSSLSCRQDHSDSDDSFTAHDISSPDGDFTDNNNLDNKMTLGQQRRHFRDDTTDGQLPTRKKLSKRNSFTNAVKHFFVSKSRSSSPETVLDCSSMTNRQDQLYNSEFTKEKISPMTTV